MLQVPRNDNKVRSLFFFSFIQQPPAHILQSRLCVLCRPWHDFWWPGQKTGQSSELWWDIGLVGLEEDAFLLWNMFLFMASELGKSDPISLWHSLDAIQSRTGIWRGAVWQKFAMVSWWNVARPGYVTKPLRMFFWNEYLPCPFQMWGCINIIIWYCWDSWLTALW